jgi:threonine aldolase
MVFATVPKESAAALRKHLDSTGIVTLGGAKMRLVTHLDVDAAGIDRVISVFGEFLQRARAGARASA